jgi:dCMP deaminase
MKFGELATLVSCLLLSSIRGSKRRQKKMRKAPNRENDLPSFDRYYIELAESVSRRANCLGKKVGAIVVVGNRIVSTGYNGVPEGMTNCMDGGCKVCYEKKMAREKDKKHNAKKNGSGKSYDDCICVHAEQNVMMTAARFGISIESGVLYTTWQPCFGCAKQMLQAKIQKIVFQKDFIPPSELWDEYQEIQDKFPGGVWKFENGGSLEMLSKKRGAIEHVSGRTLVVVERNGAVPR